MSELLTAENIANVIIFLAPGFVARQIYRSVFAVKEPGDTSILITSAVYSLAIVVTANGIVSTIHRWWPRSPFRIIAVSSNWEYVFLLFLLSSLSGWSAIRIRDSKYGRLILGKVGFTGPETGLYSGIMNVYHKLSLSKVTLNDGKIFGGILSQQEIDGDSDAKALYFSRLRRPDPKGKDGWGPETTASMLVPLENIKHIELGPPPDQSLYRISSIHTSASINTYASVSCVIVPLLLLVYLAIR